MSGHEDPAARLASIREQLAEQNAKLHTPEEPLFGAPTNDLFARLAKALIPNVEADVQPEAEPATPRAPAPNPAQGSSASGGPTLDEAIALAAQQGDWATVVVLQSRKAQQGQP